MKKIGKVLIDGREVDVWDVEEEDLLGGRCEEDGCVVNYGGGREYYCEGLDIDSVKEVEGMVVGYCKRWKRWVLVCG